jgi:hypothetical protein
MCAAEANQVVAVAAPESAALWSVRVLLAAALARALRADVDRAAIRQLFNELIEARECEEGAGDD